MSSLGGEHKGGGQSPFTRPVVAHPRQRYYTTPEEFHQQFPGAAPHYLKGLGYYAFTAGQAAPRTPKAIAIAKAKATRKATTGRTSTAQAASYYPASMQTQARTMVNDALNASLAGLRGPIKAEQAQALEQGRRAQTYTKALYDLHANDPSEIAGAYKEAAGELKGWGTGLAGAVSDAQTQAANATEAQVSQLGGGLGVSHTVVDPAAARTALLEQNVVIPGRSLQDEAAGAFATSKARALVGEMGVEQVAQDYLRRGTDLQKSLAQKASDLIATRPDLYQKALAGLQSAAQQKRALDVQVGTLQLQQAKTLADQAIAMTNITGHLYVVRGKGTNAHLVDTGQIAAGSTAAHIAQVAATAQAGQENTAAIAKANRTVHQEIADAANTTRITVANTQAAATKNAAATRANATKEAARIRARAAKAAAAITRAQGKPATVAQRSAIIANSRVAGGGVVSTRMHNIWRLLPTKLKADQQPGETPAQYHDRYDRAVKLYSSRLREWRPDIVNSVASLITPQLTLLKYGPDQITGMAEAIVSGYGIPQNPPTGWVGTILH